MHFSACTLRFSVHHVHFGLLVTVAYNIMQMLKYVLKLVFKRYILFT